MCERVPDACDAAEMSFEDVCAPRMPVMVVITNNAEVTAQPSPITGRSIWRRPGHVSSVDLYLPEIADANPRFSVTLCACMCEGSKARLLDVQGPLFACVHRRADADVAPDLAEKTFGLRFMDGRVIQVPYTPCNVAGAVRKVYRILDCDQGWGTKDYYLTEDGKRLCDADSFASCFEANPDGGFVIDVMLNQRGC